MKTLRSMTRLRWWLLAWFALYLGAAVASPIIQPQVTEMVCTSTGAVKLFVHSDGGTVELGAVGMDCPMCLLGATVPVTTHVALPVLLPQADIPALPARVFTVIATAAPPPARAPPCFS
ncbi:MAG: hypothetical protein Q8O81_02275 [Giesbergeria sp.]|nr:hypothetical protein [Giesbergeria sp.]